MRKLLMVVATMGFVVASVPAWAKTETLKGQIIDQNCYMKDKVNNKGTDHKMPADTKDCALGCAKEGDPLALLTADGKVYTIAGGLAANKGAKLYPHISHTVEITGDTMNMGATMMITADAVKMVSK